MALSIMSFRLNSFHFVLGQTVLPLHLWQQLNANKPRELHCKLGMQCKIVFWVLEIFQSNSNLGGFICTSLSWLSVTSSSSQCGWTRMASQMIECYQFRCHFAESQKMACYLKREAYSGPISFEVQQNDIWTDNIQSFEMPF